MVQIEEGRIKFQLILDTNLTVEQTDRIFELADIDTVFRGSDGQSPYVVFCLDNFADFTAERIGQAKADIKEML